MYLGEISLLTNDVPRLSDFYKALLGVENGSDDATHQFILSTEPSFTIFNDGEPHPAGAQNITLAFTVEDIYAAHEKLLSLGAEVLTPPTKRPWGATNLSFKDPDGNVVFLRSFS